MREINKNMDIGKVQKVDLQTSKTEKNEPQFCGEIEEVNVKDFSNPKEVLGRSQVNKADNLKNDVSFGIANPKAIENSDKLFELAFNKLQSKGDPNAYEKACAIATSEDAKALL